MPIGTQSPRVYPADIGAHSSFGTKFFALEARADERTIHMYALGSVEAITVYADGVLGEQEIDITTGSAVAAGHMIELYENGNVFQALVTDVTADVAFDTVEFDAPLPFAFTALGASGRVGIRNANVDGGTPAPFTLAPPTGHIWDIAHLITYIHDQTAMDSSLFGGITALTNGVSYRVYRSATQYEHLDIIKANEEFFVHGWEVDYPENMLTDHYAIRAVKRFGHEREAGAMIRLDGTKGEYLEMLVSDNLTDLDLVKFFAHGYILQDGVPG